MSIRLSRAVRGTTIAVLATLLAAVAHTLGGGGAPSPLFCAVIAALAAPFAVLLAGPRVRAWRTCAAVGISQLLFHVAFATVGDLGAWDATASGHAHHALLSAAPTVAVTAPPPSIAMLLAHAAASVVTALALRQGERVVVAIWRWAVRLVAAGPAAPAASPEPPLVRAPAPPAAMRPRIASEPLSRRGPPSLLAAF